MIKQGICIDCQKSDYYVRHNKVVPLVSERCQYHYRIYRSKACAERKKERVKVQSLAPKEKKDVELSLWYTERMSECIGRCAECNMPIPRFFRHSSIAHVLPKRKEYGFPSVATHEENSIELGAGCGCHNKYDNSWEKASKMKIFTLAVEKFKILYPFLSQEEKARIPDVFLKYIN